MKGDPMVHAAHHSTTSQPLVGAASTTETRAAQHLKRQIGPQINNFQFIDNLRVLTDDAQEPDLIDDTIYFTRLKRGSSPNPENSKEGQILQAIKNSGGLVIIAVDDEEALASLMELEYFRTDGPEILKLPDVGIKELAMLSLHEMRSKGYKLLQTTEEEKQLERQTHQNKQNNPNNPNNQNNQNNSHNQNKKISKNKKSYVNVNDPEQRLMEYIVKNNFDSDAMKESNAYLAKDMMERAITKKNERLHRLGLSAAGRLFLIPSDFGIEL